MAYDSGIALDIARNATVRSVTSVRSARLVAVDAFRGLAIVAMLLVNNIGDPSIVGYFWKHAGWISQPLGLALTEWRHALIGAQGVAAKLWLIGQFPLFRQCTLADYVMPWFMLVIGVAIPFSVAAARARNVSPSQMWMRTIKRVAMLVMLGWVIDNSIAYVNWRHAGDLAKPFGLTLGMDVLQLLGISYLVARILFDLPAGSRLAVALFLLACQWMVLKFMPQGDVPAGTFTADHDAIGYIYANWAIFRPIDLLAKFKPALAGRVTLSIVGILSVAPAAATMLLGTLIGDWLRRNDLPAGRKVAPIVLCGAISAALGFLWAYDLPFNKPRWTPSYLLLTSGIGAILIALIYHVTDVHGRFKWTRPLVVFGVNAIAAYWLAIICKIWLLNFPMRDGVERGHSIIAQLQSRVGPHAGSWAFTVGYVLIWWLILDVMYRLKIFWKV
jgi:predicted acyltransferase